MALTKEQWYAHPEFHQELRAILQNKTLLAALDMVRDSGMKPTSITPGNVDLIQFFALMGAKRDGYFEALTNLVDLSKTQPVRVPEQKPFETPRPTADNDRTSAP